MELGGIGYITSILSGLHKALYGVGLKWNYEVSKFEATRQRRPLPEGYCNVWNADPKDLCKRGYDKVIAVQKNLQDQLYAMALYHHPHMPLDQLIQLEDNRFFKVILKKWSMYEKRKFYSHQKYLWIHLDDLNHFPFQMWNGIMDFLGWKTEGRPLLFPIKTYGNWECYSTISRNKEDQLKGQLPKIKELYLNDRKIYKKNREITSQ